MVGFRIKTAFSIIILTLFLGSCARIPAGYKGVKVYLLGSSQGVNTVPLDVGRYFYWPITQEIYRFPIFQQNEVWSGQNEINFQTVEGLSVEADIGISYYVVSDSVPVLFQKYRRGIDEITTIFLRNMVIDAMNSVASNMNIEVVYGKEKQKMMDEVTAMVARQVRPFGMVIDKIYTVGDFRLPESVVRAINLKIEAIQRSQQRENEIKEVQAEAAKKVAQSKGEAESSVIRATAEADIARIRAQAEADAALIKAKAEADGNAMRIEALTPTLLQYEALKRWNGVLPSVTGSQTIPFINIDGIKK